jgi:RimJ/RimL family protein N-acetyltransferase
MSESILQTERLIVRRAAETDYPVVCELFSDSVTMKFIGPRRPMSHAESYDWLCDLLIRQTREICRYAVALKPGNELIGFAGIQKVDGVYDFGYYFRRPFWGKGFASEACEAVLNHIETVLNIHDFEIFIATANSDSSRMIERLGFVRGPAVVKDGECGVYYVRHTQPAGDESADQPE